jgi:hypothetical protein
MREFKKGCYPLILGGTIVTAAAVLGVVGGGYYFRERERTSQGNETPATKPILISTQELRRVDKQILAEAAIVAIEEGTYKRPLRTPFGNVPIPGGDSNVTLTLVGICEAGIDHGKNEPEYIPDGPDITAILSHPELFGCRNSQVHFARGEGLLNAPDSLRNEMFQKANDRLSLQALQSGIIENAAEQAELREEVRIRKIIPDVRRVNVRLRKPHPPEDAPQRTTPATASPKPSPTPIRR